MRHSALDSAARAVALDGEYVAVASPPGLGQGMREQRKGAGLAVGVALEQFDQAVFEAEPRIGGRLLDRHAQRVAGEWRHEVQTSFGQPAQLRRDREMAEEVAAHHQNHRCDPFCVSDEAATELLHDVEPHLEGEDLLELVDDQDRARERSCDRLAHRERRVAARYEEGDVITSGRQRRRETGPRKRRFSTPRGAR